MQSQDITVGKELRNPPNQSPSLPGGAMDVQRDLAGCSKPRGGLMTQPDLILVIQLLAKFSFQHTMLFPADFDLLVYVSIT